MRKIHYEAPMNTDKAFVFDRRSSPFIGG